MNTKTINYRGFESLQDIERDVSELFDGPEFADVPAEFQGTLSVTFTYSEDQPGVADKGAKAPARQQLEDALLYIRKVYRNPWLRAIVDDTMRGNMDWYDGPVEDLPANFEK